MWTYGGRVEYKSGNGNNLYQLVENNNKKKTENIFVNLVLLGYHA